MYDAGTYHLNITPLHRSGKAAVMRGLADVLPDLQALEEGQFNARFHDNTGHWHTYPLNAEAIAHLQEGIDAETPLLDVKRLGVQNYEIDYEPQ
jgi:hypothetical protein